MRSGFRPKAVPFPGEAEGEAEGEAARFPMLVITNETLSNGSYAIVDTELLKSISDGFFHVSTAHGSSPHGSSAAPSDGDSVRGGNREPGEHGESGEPGEHKAPDLIIIPSSVFRALLTVSWTALRSPHKALPPL